MNDLPEEIIDDLADDTQDESNVSATETENEVDLEEKKAQDRFNGTVGNVLQKVKDDPSKLVGMDVPDEVKE